ncbi:Wall-associated kinase family protein [Rhynchospora pubera]|uniref:Wall-associated kinase family protein n=1 Tax=Rhynchospora pubera TaxID=906938 RepID=A0AAV8CFC1_9POAL|nr:Wall-associated kinase family protein [Rhynchospora pubera]
MATLANYVILFFFLLFPFPCFSSSCETTLPCNNSIIQIRPPFFIHTPDSATDSNNNCGKFLVLCEADIPYIYIYYSVLLPLESISYGVPNTVRVKDPSLTSSLQRSNCSNIYFDFPSPVNYFRSNMYSSLHTSFSSIRCNSTDLIQSPLNTFRKDYNLNYSTSGDEKSSLLKNCTSNNSSPSFELTFSVYFDNREVSLLSANYSNHLLAKPGCFAKSTLIFACDPRCKEKQFRRRIIIGLTAGSASLLAFCSFSFFFYKRKKLKSASSLSKLLTRRESSDQYFHDLEMAGMEYTQVFSYEELKEATEGFSASNELGDGGFGTVYKGILKDRRVVAVKRLYKNNYKKAEQFINEVAILSRLHHPNLVTLYGCTALTSPELLLVFEFVPNGTIADHLHGPRSSKNALTWPVRLSIAIETANALAYLHAVEPPIIHRDVKTNNILLDDNFHVKVGDFGLSRLFPLDVTHVSTVPQGTPGYVDPVYHQCYHLTDKSDVYSFGVVLVELISSKPAVDLNRGNDEINLANMALNKIQRSQLDDLVDPDLGFRTNSDIRKMISLVAELAFQCLQSDREMRPSIKEVLEALRVIEKGNFNVNKMKENITKEETYLLRCDANSSPDTMINSWNSCSTTPNTSG